MQIKCFHVESTSCPASVVFSPAILVDQDTHGFPLVIRYDTRGRDDDDDSLIPRCCRISVTHDNVVSIRKHRARAHARTHTHSQSRRAFFPLLLFVNEPTFSLSSLLVRYFYRLTLAPRGAAMFPLRLFNKIFARIEIDDREFSRRLWNPFEFTNLLKLKRFRCVSERHSSACS